MYTDLFAQRVEADSGHVVQPTSPSVEGLKIRKAVSLAELGSWRQKDPGDRRMRTALASALGGGYAHVHGLQISLDLRLERSRAWGKPSPAMSDHGSESTSSGPAILHDYRDRPLGLCTNFT
jgi:hypothetical protein